MFGDDGRVELYDLLAYTAAIIGDPQTIAGYPSQSLVSMDYVPSEYNHEYDPYGEASHVTLVVSSTTARRACHRAAS